MALSMMATHGIAWNRPLVALDTFGTCHDDNAYKNPSQSDGYLGVMMPSPLKVGFEILRCKHLYLWKKKDSANILIWLSRIRINYVALVLGIFIMGLTFFKTWVVWYSRWQLSLVHPVLPFKKLVHNIKYVWHFFVFCNKHLILMQDNFLDHAYQISLSYLLLH